MSQQIKNKRNFSLILISAAVVLALALTVASPARAAEIITGDPNAIVPVGQVIDDDLFITGQTVEIAGTVRGDVFAAGQQVTVTGSIEGNLFVAGQLVAADGNVDGSVYSLGYAINFGSSAVVSDNVYGAGFSIEAAEGSNIGRSVYAAGYQSILSGEVGRDVNFSGAAFRLNGDVGRNLTVQIGEPEEGTETSFAYGPWMPVNVQVIEPGYVKANDATVGGRIDYSVVTYEPSSGRTYTPEPKTLWGLAVAGWIFSRVGEFLALFLVGILLVAVWPKQVAQVETQITKRTWRSLGVGFLAAILFPFAFLLAVLVIVLVGLLVGLLSLGQLAPIVFAAGFLTLGLATVIFFAAGLLAAKSIFGHLVGERLFKSTNYETQGNVWGAILALLVGLLIYEIVMLIPILGWLIGIVIVLLGLGAIIGAFWLKDKAPARKATRKAR